MFWLGMIFGYIMLFVTAYIIITIKKHKIKKALKNLKKGDKV